jgi:hypothetical protein
MTLRRMILLAMTAAFALVMPACGGEAELGEECGEAGVQEGECVDGAICGATGDAEGSLACIKVCTDDAQCAATEECNGVSGSNVKGCRPKAAQ